jgi:hypothetical protein
MMVVPEEALSVNFARSCCACPEDCACGVAVLAGWSQAIAGAAAGSANVAAAETVQTA